MKKPAAKVKRFGGAGRSAAKPDAYFAQAIGKGFRCLDLLRQHHEPLSLAEVNARMGGAKSSVFRVLHTLEALGYIQRDELGRYRAAGEPRGADRTPYLPQMIRAAESRMKHLLREFEETTSLAALMENHIEVVAVLESPQIIRMGNMPGRIIPPHASSLGKSIAAFQREERQEKLVRSYGVYRYTEHTLTGAEDLKREFARVRDHGWAEDAEENTIGGLCFGAPIFSGGPEAVAALSVSLPAMRATDGVRERIIAEVRRCASEISGELSSPAR